MEPARTCPLAHRHPLRESAHPRRDRPRPLLSPALLRAPRPTRRLGPFLGRLHAPLACARPGRHGPLAAGEQPARRRSTVATPLRTAHRGQIRLSFRCAGQRRDLHPRRARLGATTEGRARPAPALLAVRRLAPSARRPLASGDLSLPVERTVAEGAAYAGPTGCLRYGRRPRRRGSLGRAGALAGSRTADGGTGRGPRGRLDSGRQLIRLTAAGRSRPTSPRCLAHGGDLES